MVKRKKIPISQFGVKRVSRERKAFLGKHSKVVSKQNKARIRSYRKNHPNSQLSNREILQKVWGKGKK